MLGSRPVCASPLVRSAVLIIAMASPTVTIRKGKRMKFTVYSLESSLSFQD